MVVKVLPWSVFVCAITKAGKREYLETRNMHYGRVEKNLLTGFITINNIMIASKYVHISNLLDLTLVRMVGLDHITIFGLTNTLV